MCLGANCSNISVHYMTCENNCVYCKEGILYEQLNCKMDIFVMIINVQNVELMKKACVINVK